jgi:DNA primase
MDVHTLRAHDVPNVAALGSAATNRSLFERLADSGVERLILALDNDATGRAATAKAIDHAVRATRSPDVWIIDPDLLGQSKDPGELVQSHGIDDWHAAAAAPICGVAWRALDLTAPIKRPDSELGRRAALTRAGAWLGTLPPRLAIEQSAALDLVAESLAHDRDAVSRAFRARYWSHDTLREASAAARIER